MEHMGIHLGPDWPMWLLCRSYLMTHFATQPIDARVGATAIPWSVIWGRGTRSDGQRELLGAWLPSNDSVTTWRSIFGDLAARGVERIRFVVSAEASAVQAVHPGATLLSLGARQCSADLEPPSTLPMRLQRSVEASQTETELMQSELERLIRCHGPFDSTEIAADFVAKALVRVERRFRMGVPALVRPARRHAREQARATAS